MLAVADKQILCCDGNLRTIGQFDVVPIRYRIVIIQVLHTDKCIAAACRNIKTVGYCLSFLVFRNINGRLECVNEIGIHCTRRHNRTNWCGNCHRVGCGFRLLFHHVHNSYRLIGGDVFDGVNSLNGSQHVIVGLDREAFTGLVAIGNSNGEAVAATFGYGGGAFVACRHSVAGTGGQGYSVGCRCRRFGVRLCPAAHRHLSITRTGNDRQRILIPIPTIDPEIVGTGCVEGNFSIAVSVSFDGAAGRTKGLAIGNGVIRYLGHAAAFVTHIACSASQSDGQRFACSGGILVGDYLAVVKKIVETKG